jgi:hypothetical protein
LIVTADWPGGPAAQESLAVNLRPGNGFQSPLLSVAHALGALTVLRPIH